MSSQRSKEAIQCLAKAISVQQASEYWQQGRSVNKYELGIKDASQEALFSRYCIPKTPNKRFSAGTQFCMKPEDMLRVMRTNTLEANFPGEESRNKNIAMGKTIENICSTPEDYFG